jgi:hypothetical protein
MLGSIGRSSYFTSIDAGNMALLTESSPLLLKSEAMYQGFALWGVFTRYLYVNNIQP